MSEPDALARRYECEDVPAATLLSPETDTYYAIAGWKWVERARPAYLKRRKSNIYKNFFKMLHAAMNNYLTTHLLLIYHLWRK
jgi:hypothetical protein